MMIIYIWGKKGRKVRKKKWQRIDPVNEARLVIYEVFLYKRLTTESWVVV